MNRLPVARVAGSAAQLARSAFADIRRNRWLALGSLAAAVVLWAFIEDVENPRLEAVVPAEGYQPIPVEAVNLADGLVMSESVNVRVRVKANADDVRDLTADDFRATIDANDLVPGETVARVVNVESRRPNVRVVAVQPPDVLVTALEASTRELPVTVRLRGELPAGFRVLPGVSPAAEPSIARITGKADLVSSVAAIEIEATITGVREESFVVEGELVARTAAGNRVDVQLTPGRGRATVRIEQIVSQRLVPVLPQITGATEKGYRVVAITIDPAAVTVSGPTDVIEGLKLLSTERIDITGAKTDVVQTKQIGVVPNTTTDRQSVVVRVEIKPFDCGSLLSSPCGRVTVYAAPVFDSAPAGMVPQPGVYSVAVRLSGPLPELNAIGPADVRVSVSLRGVRLGSNVVQPTATVSIAGVTIEEVEKMTVVMVQGVSQ